MSFQPVIPAGGLVGWAFLKRTATKQEAALAAAPQEQRDTAYFAQTIGSVKTAADLVDDRRLLRVALGAFGLEDDIGNRFFIRKVLEEGTLSRDALANRLTDERYKSLSKAFGFGDFAVPRTALSGFSDEIIASYRAQAFERAVGEQNDDLRLAMNMTRELEGIAQSTASEATKWFRVMGNPPLRQVFETALGLPASFGRLDLDQQLETFQDKVQRRFGTRDIADFESSDRREALAQAFLLRSQIAIGAGFSPAQAALSLLQAP